MNKKIEFLTNSKERLVLSFRDRQKGILPRDNATHSNDPNLSTVGGIGILAGEVMCTSTLIIVYFNSASLGRYADPISPKVNPQLVVVSIKIDLIKALVAHWLHRKYLYTCQAAQADLAAF